MWRAKLRIGPIPTRACAVYENYKKAAILNWKILPTALPWELVEKTPDGILLKSTLKYWDGTKKDTGSIPSSCIFFNKKFIEKYQHNDEAAYTFTKNKYTGDIECTVLVTDSVYWMQFGIDEEFPH